MTDRPLRVFLCHSSADKVAVRDLYEKLTAHGIDAWLDERKLLPGQLWKNEIPKAVREADAVIICLSKTSITKEGYVQKEIKFALDIALEKPEGTIYLIPARLEECKVPDSLSDWHWVNLFETQGIDFLLRALDVRASSLSIQLNNKRKRENEVAKALDAISTGLSIGQSANPQITKTISELIGALKEESDGKQSPTPEKSQAASLTYGDKITLSNGMEFMRVPAGKFIMGNEKEDDEKPQRTVDIPYDYWMAYYPVTNEQYNAYAQAKGMAHPVADWQKKKEHPVVNVSWDTVMEYSKWLNQILNSEFRMQNLEIRLPTEAEWEKAARSTDGREYPWGNTFDKNKCNSSEGGKSGTTPVGMYSPQGDSPYGCADMAGNVWEWTHSEYKPYPYNAKDGREDEQKAVVRVVRGGAFNSNERFVRCAYRYWVVPYSRGNSIGFRVVASSFQISLLRSGS